ncbi:MAG: hypothetical protein JWM00_449 [Candidatus Saccharibacteria bacterium]|nr:hypothetical protein [Candidatus Saccharibacteria bacterium]
MHLCYNILLMNSIDSFPRISHSDLDAQIGKTVKLPRIQAAYTREAIAVAAKKLGTTKQAVEIGQRVTNLTVNEEERRRAHHTRYRHMIAMSEGEHIVTGETDNLVESALVDFNTRAAGLSVLTADSYWRSAAKGVSGELAYVEQLGNWDSAHDLDEQVRGLKESPVLADAGITLEHIHQDDDAKINYGVRFVNLHDHTSSPLSILVVRKRAVADVRGSNGEEIELVRRSGFLINPLDLSRNALIDILDNGMSKVKDRRKAWSQEFGEATVEPFFEDKKLRDSSTKVLPVTSLYFALDRHIEPQTDENV